MIRNADGTVGNVISANKFMMDNNLQSKYRLLNSYTNSKNKVAISAGGTSGTKGQGTELNDILSANSPTLVGFLSKMEKFYFSPPSDNLWTINIDIDDSNFTNGTSLGILYKNITAMNSTWKNKISNSKWSIDTSKAASSGNTAENFINEFIGVQGVFLAQNISFTPMQTTVNSNVFPMGQ